MEIVIREIEEKDYTDVTAILINEIWNSNASSDYGDAAVRFFNEIKNDEHYKTFIALLDNHVVGVISTMKMSWIASSVMFVQVFAVKRENQHKGIGTKLIKHIEDYAKAHGMTGIGLQSGVQRAGAHAFYACNGFVKSNYFYKNF